MWLFLTQSNYQPETKVYIPREYLTNCKNLAYIVYIKNTITVTLY